MSEQQKKETEKADVELQEVKTVDTVHNDEALKVLNDYQGDSNWSEEEEKKLQKKVDWRLMPVMCMTYGLQYYDKAMLSQAVSRSVFLLRLSFPAR